MIKYMYMQVRMTKTPFGSKLCKVSNVPFQGFRWKAGTNGRFKETMVTAFWMQIFLCICEMMSVKRNITIKCTQVCIQVAQHRNICQACLNDMQYGLPVGVRDKLLKEGKLNNQMMVMHFMVVNLLCMHDMNLTSQIGLTLALILIIYVYYRSPHHRLVKNTTIKNKQHLGR